MSATEGSEKIEASYIIYIRMKKHFKNDQRNRDAAAKKRANTSGV